MTAQAVLCQIKPEITYSSAIQHHMAVLEWFWAGRKLESYFGNKLPGPFPPLPTLCLGIYKCIPLGTYTELAGHVS